MVHIVNCLHVLVHVHWQAEHYRSANARYHVRQFAVYSNDSQEAYCIGSFYGSEPSVLALFLVWPTEQPVKLNLPREALDSGCVYWQRD